MNHAARVLVLSLVSAALASPSVTTPRASHTMSFPGIPVEMLFHTLQPGEVILATFKSSPPAAGAPGLTRGAGSGAKARPLTPAKNVILKVGRRRFVLGAGPGAQPFALIGLDVELKPEPLALTILEPRADGTFRGFREDLPIEPREYSQRHFYVNEEMLSPPKAEQERVKREADLLQAVFDIFTPEWLATGNFVSPIPDREAYPNFGQRRIYNKTRTSVHAGVDIAAPWGTPARASNAGRVVLAGRLYFSGQTVIIDHGLGVFSFYGHFSKILVKRGDLVKKGQVIAKVGNTGRSTGPHLHWAVRIFDSRVDPFSLVSLPFE